MKKYYIYIVSAFFAVKTQAQRNAESTELPLVSVFQTPQVIENSQKAASDTLFWFEGRYMVGVGFSTNSTPPFQYSLQDVDQKTLDTTYTNHGYPSQAPFIVNVKVNAPGDTSYYFSAISYFTPPGIANDWVSFGPIAIPATGAILSWKHNYPNENFRDGYKVHVNTVGVGYTNFIGTPVFTVDDNDVTTASDTANIPLTLFYARSVDISSYAGQAIYIGFQHDADDQDRFFLDDIFIQDKAATSITSNTLPEAINIYPNPSKGLFTINFPSVSTRNIIVYNLMAEIVFENTFTTEIAAVDLSNMSAGVYTLKSFSQNGNVTVKELVIVK